MSIQKISKVLLLLLSLTLLSFNFTSSFIEPVVETQCVELADTYIVAPTPPIPSRVKIKGVWPVVVESLHITFVDEDGERTRRNDDKEWKNTIRHASEIIEYLIGKKDFFRFNQSTRRAGDIRIFIGGNATGRSYVGTDAWKTRNPYTMSFGSDEPHSTLRVIMHELFGHCLLSERHGHVHVPRLDYEQEFPNDEYLYDGLTIEELPEGELWKPDGGSIMHYRLKKEDMNLAEILRNGWDVEEFVHRNYDISRRDLDALQHFDAIREKVDNPMFEKRYKYNSEIVKAVKEANRLSADGIDTEFCESDPEPEMCICEF